MTTSLARNRDYGLLWGSQALSVAGYSATMIAFPLLVLAITGSPALSGLLLGLSSAAQLAVGLPAGVVADRWSRKKIMLACEAGQVVAAASVVLALWWHALTVWQLALVAVVIGVCKSLFTPAEIACLPRLVASDQLTTALAMNSARANLGQLAGTAAGGFLFAIGRAVPFLADLPTHLLSLVGLAFVRVPPTPPATTPSSHLLGDMVEGLRWTWREPHVRLTALCTIILNFCFTAYYIVIIVLARTDGVPSGEIGVMAAMLGGGGIIGSLLAPRLYRRFSPYLCIVGVFWALAVLAPVAVLLTNGYLIGVLFAAIALLPPTASIAINTSQLLLTPDEMRGRLSGAMAVSAGVAAALGPTFGGLMLEWVSTRSAVLLCAGGIAVSAVVFTVSRTMRHFPTERELTARAEADLRLRETNAPG